MIASGWFILALIIPRANTIFTRITNYKATRKFATLTLLPLAVFSMVGAGIVEPDSIKQQHKNDRSALIAEEERRREEDTKREQEQEAEELENKRLQKLKNEERDRQAAEEREKLEEQKQAEDRQRKLNEDRQKQQEQTASKPKTNTPPATSPQKPSTPGGTGQVVHPGSFCSTDGATAQFKTGNKAVCKIDSKGKRLRWQSP